MSGKLFFICGEDEYLVEQAARERISHFIPEAEQPHCVEVIDGHKESAEEIRKSVLACKESVQTPGFFGGQKLTWFRDVTFLTGGGRASEGIQAKASVELLSDWLNEGLAPDQILIISALKILRTSIFFKTCKKVGEVIDFGGALKPWEMEKVAEERLPDFLRKAGIEMDEDARKEFLDRVGFDTRLIISEIEKLRLYLYPKTRGTTADIREITSVGREAEAWDLLDAFGMRDPVAFVSTLHQLSGQRGIGIMLASMLEKNIKELIIIREAYDQKWIYGNGSSAGWSTSLSPETTVLLNTLPVNPKTLNAWALKRKLPHALNYTLHELRIARFRILELREKLVSTSTPEIQLLETSLLRIIGKPKPRDVKIRSFK